MYTQRISDTKYIVQSMNLLVAGSNFPCILPLFTSYRAGDYLTTITIGFSSIVSTAAHLFENYNHNMLGMPWLKVSKSTSHLLFRINDVGIVMVIARLMWLLYKKHKLNSLRKLKEDPMSLLSLAVTFALHQLSDYSFNVPYDRIIPRVLYDRICNRVNPRIVYVCAHSLWHMSIFCLMDEFLKNFIY